MNSLNSRSSYATASSPNLTAFSLTACAFSGSVSDS